MTKPHSDRMPTISASEALQTAITTDVKRSIELGIPEIDALLSGADLTGERQPHESTGLLYGEVTEVTGPPGVGKTCLWYGCRDRVD